MKEGLSPELIFADNFCNSVMLIRERNPKACWLLVEGATDYQALHFIFGSSCTCQDSGGRGFVIAAIQMAQDPKQQINGIPLDGIIGLVDSDYCRLIEEKKLPSRVVRFEGVNDLESAALMHRGPFILDSLARIKEWIDPDPWGLTNKKNPLDALIKNIVGPIGALRVAFQTMQPEFRPGKKSFRGKLDKTPSFIVERAWKHQNPSLQITSEILSSLPDDELVPETNDRHKLKKNIESHMEIVNKNPWSYVKGKDLVGTLANALALNKQVLIHKNSTVAALDIEIQRMIPLVFDEEVLAHCRFKELVKEVTLSEAGIYQYF